MIFFGVGAGDDRMSLEFRSEKAIYLGLASKFQGHRILAARQLQKSQKLF
jgi:hypothetical protein